MRQMHKSAQFPAQPLIIADFRENPRNIFQAQPNTAATMWNSTPAITAVAGTVTIQAATMRSTADRFTISFL